MGVLNPQLRTIYAAIAIAVPTLTVLCQSPKFVVLC